MASKKNKRLEMFAKFFLVLILSVACRKSNNVVLEDAPVFDPLESGYALIWSDEFDGNHLDDTKWSHRALGKRHLAINRKSSVFLDGKGHLCIEMAKKDTVYYAGMIGSQGKFEQLYGYFECSVEMQKSIGPHSAFWLQSPKIGQVGNPSEIGAEVDIYEYMRYNSDYVINNLYWDYKAPILGNVMKWIYYPAIKKGFHTFGLEWDENGYTYYVDGHKSSFTDKAVSGIPLYIVLSAEITGKWGPINLIDKDTVKFDYVRVYQKIEVQGGYE